MTPQTGTEPAEKTIPAAAGNPAGEAGATLMDEAVAAAADLPDEDEETVENAA